MDRLGETARIHRFMTPTNPFPRLTPANHRITSPSNSDYNCIAWSLEDTEHWWQPGVFWPISGTTNDYGIETLERALQELGYEACAEGHLEPGFAKVALYGTPQFYTHAARQLSNGRWTSKLGLAEDIEHDSPEDVADGLYGPLAKFMRKPMLQTVQAPAQ
jgi:hypothetical protein